MQIVHSRSGTSSAHQQLGLQPDLVSKRSGAGDTAALQGIVIELAQQVQGLQGLITSEIAEKRAR